MIRTAHLFRLWTKSHSQRKRHKAPIHGWSISVFACSSCWSFAKMRVLCLCQWWCLGSGLKSQQHTSAQFCAIAVKPPSVTTSLADCSVPSVLLPFHQSCSSLSDNGKSRRHIRVASAFLGILLYKPLAILLYILCVLFQINTNTVLFFFFSGNLI